MTEKKADPRKRSAAAAGKRTADSGRPAPRRTKATKDPHGGLTPAGREYFLKKEGAHLRPGVRGKADTPEKEMRKGSFLRRHFAHARGPMERDGKPTRLALSAQAWGEPLPKTAADVCKLAAKGSRLLEQYKKDKVAGKAPAKKRTAAKLPAKKTSSRQASSGAKTAPSTSAKRASRKKS